MTAHLTVSDFESFLLAGGHITLDEWAALDDETREGARSAGERVAAIRGECVADAITDAVEAFLTGLAGTAQDARIHKALDAAVARAAERGAA